MAEKYADASPSESSTQDERSSGNWWDSWLTSAKSKSAEVYTMVKKDLDEIGSAVKSEASHVLSSTSSVIGKTLKLENPESTANVMKKSLSTFIGQVSTVLNPEPDDEDDTEVILSSGDTTMLSTYKKELEALQRVDATFIVPADSPEFSAWLASLEGGEEGVATPASAERRLMASPVLLTQYRRLVPDAVSHTHFWTRYLFRVALLQDRLAAASRKQPEEAPTTDPVLANLPLQTQSQATPIQQSPKKVLSGIDSDQSADRSPYKSTDKSDDKSDDKSADNSEIENVVVAWEDEDFADNMELTEEQQTLLLEEYEKEISTKKHSKNSPKSKTPRDAANNNTKQTNTITKSKTKSAQTRDKMNNKQTATAIGKGHKNGGKSPKKQIKDVCGNNLVEDYFGKEENEDSNSDESWEKEFEIEDVEQKA